jgi:hypothetical protein
MRLTAAVAAAAIAWAGAASASVITVTWTGHVASGIDNAGWFAPVGTDLTGAAWSAVFTYDTTNAADYSGPGDGDTTFPSIVLEGGGSAGPVIGGAVLNISGTGFNIPGSFFDGIGIHMVDADGDPLEFGTYAASLLTTQIVLDARLRSPPIPFSVTTPFEATSGLCDDFCMGSFSIPNGTSGQLTPETVKLEVATEAGSGAPEPAAWALMIAGFGAAGAVLRRRRLTNPPALPAR